MTNKDLNFSKEENFSFEKIQSHLHYMISSESDRMWDVYDVLQMFEILEIFAVANHFESSNFSEKQQDWIQENCNSLNDKELQNKVRYAIKRIQASEYLEEVMWPTEENKVFWFNELDTLLAFLH